MEMLTRTARPGTSTGTRRRTGSAGATPPSPGPASRAGAHRSRRARGFFQRRRPSLRDGGKEHRRRCARLLSAWRRPRCSRAGRGRRRHGCRAHRRSAPDSARSPSLISAAAESRRRCARLPSRSPGASLQRWLQPGRPPMAGNDDTRLSPLMPADAGIHRSRVSRQPRDGITVTWRNEPASPPPIARSRAGRSREDDR
jgi:hypothetical protein